MQNQTFRPIEVLLDETKEEGWRLGHRMGFWMNDPFPRHELYDSFDEAEYTNRLQQYLGKLQCRANDVERRNLYYTPVFDEGRLRRRMYPWMLDQHRRRSAGLIDRLNVEFTQHSGDEMYHPALGGYSPDWTPDER